MRRRLLLLGTVVAAVLAVVAVLATGLGRDPSASASPLVGRTAPDFTLGGIDGPAVTLSSLRGQVVVLPCRRTAAAGLGHLGRPARPLRCAAACSWRP